MAIKKHKDFSNRLIDAMQKNGYSKSNSPNGICVETLSKIAGTSEQICRRYVRGDALPDYDKIIGIASALNVSPGWLLFGEQPSSNTNRDNSIIDDELLYYIIHESFSLHHKNCHIDIADCTDFIVGLIRELEKIETTSKESLRRIINLALGSITTSMEKRNKISYLK